MIKLTPFEQKQLLKMCKGKKSISAKEYREALSGGGTQQRKNIHTKKVFSFVSTFIKHTPDTYELIVKGRHLSTNSVLSLSFKDKLRYKKILKQSILDAGLIQKKLLPKKNIYASLIPTAYNPRSRDDDNNGLTLKYIRDMIVQLGFAKDDTREYLSQGKCEEVISKEWKISMVIKTSQNDN